MMKKAKTRRLTSLFFRILGTVAIPLLFLLGAFTFLVTKRELDLQTRLYAQEGRSELESLAQPLEELLLQPAVMDSPSALRQELARLEKVLEIEKIDLIDPSRQISLAGGLSRKISEREMLDIQKSLSLKREGKPYYEVVDERAQKFYGYLPLRDKARNRILVAATEFHLLSLSQALTQTFATLILMTIFVLAAAFVIAFSLTIRIVRPIRAINRACRDMLSGKMGLQVKVKTRDELELLADNFNRMSRSLLEFTRQAEDANPLTQLPGNRRITEEIMRRLEVRERFVCFHVDIDHFKAYNDHYGLSRGDDVLRKTGEILSEAVRAAENPRNFIGHQGGDDFILILDPVDARPVGEKVCKNFDAAIREFYDKEDFERGYFMEVDSRADAMADDTELKRQPLMSISLAGVTNLKNDFQSFEDVLQRAVPMKKKAKKIPYSKFLIEE